MRYNFFTCLATRNIAFLLPAGFISDSEDQRGRISLRIPCFKMAAFFQKKNLTMLQSLLHSEMHFHGIKSAISIKNSPLQMGNWRFLRSGLCKVQLLNRHQAIIWNNGNTVYWLLHAWSNLNKLICVPYTKITVNCLRHSKFKVLMKMNSRPSIWTRMFVCNTLLFGYDRHFSPKHSK